MFKIRTTEFIRCNGCTSAIRPKDHYYCDEKTNDILCENCYEAETNDASIRNKIPIKKKVAAKFI